MNATPWLTFSSTIDPLEGIAVLGTIFVAIYVSSILETQMDSDKVQRDLALRRANDLDDGIHELATFVTSPGQNISDINFRLKKIFLLSQSVNKLLKLIKHVKNGFPEDFEGLHKDLKNLMTNTPIDQVQANDSPVTIKDGKISYTRERLREIEIKIDKIKDCIFELQIHIART